ncbi:hypothetical protein AQ505_10970 [Pedobacter sp. PACM 27299]|uniref:hypothetical protein n=1 Tax=Pedobacter sp. PACM 27299 TaxID=1727164 RepID=UPI000705A647|nr:hypothetical protein [Pedobacter sp. PACM 27299]ALL05969.1 hypothetical protein AQ505_10970 [Pedobacter sp. PACM 27299]
MQKILKQLDYQPARLSDDELQNPENLITEFFDNTPIHECRDLVWELFKGWTYHTAEYDSNQTTNMLLFYTQLIGFLNASFVHIEKERLESTN